MASVSSQSICYGPVDAERQFHKCTTKGSSPQCFFDNEFKQIVSGIPFASRMVLEGTLRDVVNTAARGELKPAEQYIADSSGAVTRRKDPPPVSPCISQPDIWELRHRGRKGELYRLYFAEPKGDGAHAPELVMLLIHRKEVAEKKNGVWEKLDDAEIKRRQNLKMTTAQARFKTYASNNWGHTNLRCRYCIDNNRLITDELGV